MSDKAKVTGIGGVFFRARDPKALAAWYREHLGVPIEGEGTYGVFSVDSAGRDAGGAPLQTVWSTFPNDTEYFGPGGVSWMFNYRVSNLDAMLTQLRASGVWVSDKVEDYEYGRFGWAADPEGHRFELWQPPVDKPAF
jgi:predicted enzyme related to lactoylglutathione lyase